MDQHRVDFEASFDINDISFGNVSAEFEKKFREKYKKSLSMISDDKNPLAGTGGANSLGVLEAMGRRIDNYDMHTDFDKSYYELLRELEPFTET